MRMMEYIEEFDSELPDGVDWPDHHVAALYSMAEEGKAEIEASGKTIQPAQNTSTITQQVAEVFGLEGESNMEVRRWLRAAGILQRELNREPTREEVLELVKDLRVEDGEREAQRTGHVDSGARGSNWQGGPCGARADPIPPWQQARSHHPADGDSHRVPDRDWSNYGTGQGSYQNTQRNWEQNMREQMPNRYWTARQQEQRWNDRHRQRW